MNSLPLALAIIALTGAGTAVAQDLKPVTLPAPKTDGGMPLMQAIAARHSTREFSTKQLPLQELSNLLWAADGINRRESGKRTAPSAMNWQETDVYVLMAEGAYVYDPAANELKPVAGKDLRPLAGTQEFVGTAPLNLVYVIDRGKMSRAGEDDKRLYGAADVGFIAENVYLYCASEGLVAVVRGSVDRQKLGAALNLRPDQSIILAQTVGYPAK
ncbi:MAG TPA: nitroreductase family protein [Bacteroidota bacterium]|nr:nitroreductase family protein [Bacteroidota bacterium]